MKEAKQIRQTEPLDIAHPEVKRNLDSMHLHGVDAGQAHGLNIDCRWRKKSTLYIYGPDHSGKSRLFFFTALAMAERHGWKFLIYSPETGDAADIFAMLIKIFCGTNTFQKGPFGVTDEGRKEATHFIMRHFKVVDYFRGITMDDIYEQANELNSTKWHVDCLCIDPFNAVKHDIDATPRDIYLGDFLLDFDQDATKNNRLNVLIVHPASQELETQEGENGQKIKYYGIADKRNIMWGQEWLRKGKNLWSVWRPTKEGLRDADGNPYPKGYLVVDVQKRKPDEVGEVGVFHVYFNWMTQRYYNDANMTDCPLKGLTTSVQPLEEKSVSLKPNKHFADIDLDNDVPF